MLPGDEVLLMLVESAGRYLPQAKSGVLFFSNGVARPQESSPLEASMRGKTQGEVVAQVRAAIPR